MSGRSRAAAVRLIRGADVDPVAEPANGLRLWRLLGGAGSGRLSVALVEIDGRHRPLRTERSDRAYYLLDGALRFAFETAPPCAARGGDLVLVPAGEGYALSGTGRYLVINGPGFRDGDDVWIDDADWARQC